MTTIVYDIEIAKAIPDRRAAPTPGVAYCEGWHDHKGMGIATLCAYDYSQDRVRVFCEDNKAEFAELVRVAECVAGFNNTNFDNKVLLATWGVEVPTTSNYDIMTEVLVAAQTDRFAGYGLNACAAANGMPQKTGNGALAPVDWQLGRYGSVIDYCINDVLITRRLLDRIREQGTLIDPKTAQVLKIRQPPRRPQ